MRVALVHPSLAVRGGAEHVVLWLAGEWQRRGRQVTVITTDYDDRLFGPRDALPFSIVTLPLGGYAMDPLAYLRAGWLLRHVLSGFDWVNPHNFPAYIWTYLARLANPRIGPIIWLCEEPVRWFYPEVCNPHLLELQRRTAPADPRPGWLRRAASATRRLIEWRFELSRILDRGVVPRLDAVVANSEFIAGQVRTIFSRPATACHLGIPERRFSPTDGDPPAAAQPYLLTVSRLHPEKNIETVLRAVRVLRDRMSLPFRRYVIAGDGPLRAKLESAARDLGLSDVVEFAGAVSDQRLATLYRHAELVVYLPLDETFGLVFLEAALFSRPVLGPNHGGPSEIVRDGVTGLLVDPLDPYRVAQAIADALANPRRRQAWGEEGYRLVLRDYTIVRFVDRFDDAVRSVISR